jgi:hypothetical protein
MRVERLGWPDAERRKNDVVAGQRACQLVHEVGIAALYLQAWMAARDLRGGADERGHLVCPGQGDVDKLGSGVPARAQDEEPHGLASYW